MDENLMIDENVATEEQEMDNTKITRLMDIFEALTEDEQQEVFDRISSIMNTEPLAEEELSEMGEEMPMGWWVPELNALQDRLSEGSF